jgi:hypothetical protein
LDLSLGIDVNGIGVYAMSRSKWRYWIFAALVAAILGGGLLATAWRQPRPRPVRQPAPTLTVHTRAPGGGVLAFSAVAKGVRIDGRGPAMAWYVEVYGSGESTRPVWGHNYDEMSVEPGTPPTVGLPEQVIPGGLPAGTYQLFVALRETEDPAPGPDGLPRRERMTITRLTEPFEVR